MGFEDGLIVAKKLLATLGKYGEDQEFWYHGRNEFDLKFLRMFFFMLPGHFGYYQLYKYFPPKRCISTLDIAKKHLNLSSYSLKSVCDYLDIKLNHHDALSDAWASYHIYRKLEKVKVLY